MVYTKFLLVSSLLLKGGLSHFVEPLSMCILAAICNHIGTPECGLEKRSGESKQFRDECDRFEYNCDNRKEFERTDLENCTVTTTTMTTTNAPTTTTITTPTTTTSTSTTNTAEPTTRECTRNEGNTILTTVLTTSPPTTTIIPSTKTTTPSTTTVLTTTHSTTTEMTTTTLTSTTTPLTSTTTTASSTSSTTSSTVITTTSPTKTTVHKLTHEISSTTCTPYPKDCNFPTTWETTVEGETRDFFQILKERYDMGRRYNIFQKPPGVIIVNHRDNSFLSGRHNEGDSY